MGKQYSKKDIKSFLAENPSAEGLIGKKSDVVEEGNLLKAEGKTLFIRPEDVWLPHLKLLQDNPRLLPRVIVDMGAVKFVVKGADIMRPGIKETGDFSKGDHIIVADETHGKPLAVGEALLSSEDMGEQEKGKSVKNLHYVGDEYWDL
ncbi:MAG: PUA domain-containing protein [Nanobdellota archaeon]